MICGIRHHSVLGLVVSLVLAAIACSSVRWIDLLRTIRLFMRTADIDFLLPAGKRVIHRHALQRRLQIKGRRFEPAGDIILQSFGSVEYSGQIKIGAQTFQVIFDTGSSNLWVLDQDFNGSAGHTRYNKSLSSTYKADGRDFHCMYGSGKAWGILAQDTLELRGIRANVTFGLVHRTTIVMPGDTYDGILGLGWSSNSVGNFATPVEMLHGSGALQEPVFAFYFPKLDDGSAEILFGGLDATKYDGDITWISVLAQDNSKQWAVMLSEAKFGQETFGNKEQFAIIDSGMSHIGVPFELFDPLMTALGDRFNVAATRFGLNSTAILESLPSLTLRLGSFECIIRGLDYMLIDSANVAHPMLGKLPPRPSWQTFWSLGDVFFRTHYVAFDYRNGGRIGIALAV